MALPADAIDALRDAQATVATAESLTGGLVCATLVGIPGASDVVLGGIVAYAVSAKIGLLGVDSDLLAEHGAVNAEVAAQLALGVRDRFGATYGLSTTGEAGPDSFGGQPVGTVFLGVASPDGVTTTKLELVGDRDTIRTDTVAAVLSQLVARLGEESRAPRG